MPLVRNANIGKEKFLIVVDILSRKVFAYVLASGTMKDVLVAYKDFLKDCGFIPMAVSGDAFFDHNEFKDLNESKNTKVYTSVSKDTHMNGKYKGNKLGIVDSAVKTIKNYLTEHVE